MVYTHTKLGIQPGDAQVHASYEGSSAKYAYLRQHIQGVPVANAVANVAFNKANQVVAFGSSFLQNGTSLTIHLPRHSKQTRFSEQAAVHYTDRARARRHIDS